MVPIYLWCRLWYNSSDSALLPRITLASWVFLSGTNASGLAATYSAQGSASHTLPSLCFMSMMFQQPGPKFRNKDYWRGCMKEGHEQRPHLLVGKISNSLAVKWKEARPMRETKLRISAARVWTGTKVCFCHLQSAFPQPMNWIFALPTSQRQSVNAPFCFFGFLKHLNKVYLMLFI